MEKDKLGKFGIDHLYREEYGKMVSSLIRVFGIGYLNEIEDAVQDSFYKAIRNWPEQGIPEIPEAWLRKVSRNSIIDIFRKMKSNLHHEKKISSGAGIIPVFEVFSEYEIADNQLRLLFTICHPKLSRRDQLIFALKSFSGFSRKEIAAALMQSEENIKKALSRSRKLIAVSEMKFEVPTGVALEERLESVHLVIYLLFNEGFHSAGRSYLVREDLVAEALRLGELLVEKWENKNTYALMALMCFHASRLNAKISDDNVLISLKDQDRSKWSKPLMMRGHFYLNRAVEHQPYSRFHWEAAIAGEHARAERFESTQWLNLEHYYTQLIKIEASALNLLNKCVILLKLDRTLEAEDIWKKMDSDQLSGRKYLYFAVGAEIYQNLKDVIAAGQLLEKALKLTENESERQFIRKKLALLSTL